jgi:thiamine biosynthesis lipoprotein
MTASSAVRTMVSGAPLMMTGIVLILSAACDTSSGIFRYDLDVLGTSAEIVIAGLPAKKAHQVARSVEKHLEQLDHIGYTFESGSELHKLNQAISRGESITVSAELKGLMEEARRLNSASNGLFNPAAGELTALWEYRCDRADCTESPYPEEVRHLIDEKEAEIISQQPSMDDLLLDGDRVLSRKSVVKLEFGDMIRGFALDQAMAQMKELGVKNAMISIGSGVRVVGTRGGKPWWIGLPLHSTAEKMVGTIESTNDEAVITLHAVDRSVGNRGAVYRHVVDPRTGLPVRATRSVTVIHASATTANAAAAALLINGRDGWSGVAEKMGVRRILLITQDGTIYTSSEMEERLHWKQGRTYQRLTR